MRGRNVNRQFLALLTAAAVSTAAFVSACGAAEDQAAETATQATETQAAAPAAGTSPVQVADAGDKAEAKAEGDGGAAKTEENAEEKAAEGDKAEGAEAAAPAAEGEFLSAIERVQASPKGTLKNPFTGDETAIAEGQKLYMGLSCNGCHGGGGGGGMCPPLTNEVWVYGGDDDTLFRLITLGTKDLQAEGYARKGTEGVVGPMMAYRDLIDDERKLWKIIAWIRSKWGGREERKEW